MSGVTTLTSVHHRNKMAAVFLCQGCVCVVFVDVCVCVFVCLRVCSLCVCV